MNNVTNTKSKSTMPQARKSWAKRVSDKLEERKNNPVQPAEPRRIWNMNPEVDGAIFRRWNSKIREVIAALKGVEWMTIDVFRIGTYYDCPPTVLIGARDRKDPLWESALERVREVVGDILVVELEQADVAKLGKQPRMIAGMET